MIIDDKIITYLEDLSNLSLSGDEKKQFKNDLSKILESFECVKKVDTKGVVPSVHPFGEFNNLREDIVTPSVDRDILLKNASNRDEETFIAPKTME